MSITATCAGWWLYFGLLALHVATAPLLERLDPVGWASWVLSGAGLLGLWGYLRQRPIGWRPLWVAYFIALLLGVIHDLAMSFLRPELEGNLVLMAGIAIGLALNLPLLWATWRYAFRSREMWKGDGCRERA